MSLFILYSICATYLTLSVKANVDRILQNTERGGNAQEKGTVSFAANCALY